MKQSIGERQRDEGGFTLLEILVVIAILGLLIGLVAPAALRQLGGAKNNITHQAIQRIGSVLDLYKLDVGSYPSTEQSLQALLAQPVDVTNWNGPYLKSSHPPLDPWNHPYSYQSPSTRTNYDYDLCSEGPDAGNTAEASPGTPGSICN